MKRKSLKERGITLVSLVIIIIVLLILSAVTIKLVVGEEGLIQKTKDARNVYQKTEENESKKSNEYVQKLRNVMN